MASVSLRALIESLGQSVPADAAVSGIAHDSRSIRPGDLFVALPGTKLDGARFVQEAARRGAVAAVVSRDAQADVDGVALPVIRVDQPRAALARLSAAFFGQPARALQLIGITGTLGKTSTALVIQTALAASSTSAVGMIGSLGARLAGGTAREQLPDFAGMTTPDAPALHRALRAMADAGARTVAMEVTSHALAQHRVDGLVFALGVITNLVPDEHLDFHGTAEHYLATKARFLDHLADDAPIIFNADDRLVRHMIAVSLARHQRTVIGVSLGEAARALDKDPDDLAARDAAVVVEELRWDASGATFVLAVRRAIPRLGGGELAECAVPIILPVLGIQLVSNAALAATAALVAGAPPEAVTHALAEMPAARRRMEVVRSASPLVIDDTAGHPDTLRAVFTSIDPISRSGIRILFGLRGSRGAEINERLAATLAELVGDRAREESVRLVITFSDDTASERDRVMPEERAAATRALEGRLERLAHTARLRPIYEPTLAEGVRVLLADVRDDELVLLLGAQGMDRAAELARAWFAARPR